MSILPNMTLIADSLGWAVLHSLWQGLVAAGLVIVVRSLSNERAAELRYFTGIVTLCSLLFAFIGTFLYYFNTGVSATSGAALSNIQTITLTTPETVIASNPLLRFADYTNLIGIFWALGFTVLGIRYLSAFRMTHILRTTGLSALPTDWQTRFERLAAKSDVSSKVRAYFSEHVSSPITFGFLKPIVLLPAWFFTGMTSEQCEAVILHELAHIRRHDYLTNILQIIIKTVFFYHPAVGFICKGLDTDREHACDDFAVLLNKNPESLATALGTIRLKAARDGGVFALSASGRDAPLIGRLKRLMGTQASAMQKGTTRGLAAMAMLVASAALLMILGTTVSQANPQKQNGSQIRDEIILAGGDTQKTDIVVNGQTYSVVKNYDKTTAKTVYKNGHKYFIINGKKYLSKYDYSFYAKDGKTYVVKTKNNGKDYIQIGGNWHQVRTKSQSKLTPLTPPTNYLVSDQTWQANEDRIERANERRQAALERAQQRREASFERAEDRRQAAWELAQERREAEIERKQAHLRQKIERKKRTLDSPSSDRVKKINKLEQKIQSKRTKLKNAHNMSQNELGRLQGEIGRLQGQIGRMQGERGRGQRELGRLQSELGQLQGELGRMQGEWGQKMASLEQKKYYAMRDRLIQVLKADGYMKTDRSKVTIKMTPTDIFINGEQLTNAKESKYCDIVSDYIDRKGNMKKIVIKPGYLHISYKDAKSNSNYSYTHNEN